MNHEFILAVLCVMAVPVVVVVFGWLGRKVGKLGDRIDDQRNLARRQWRRNRYRKDVLGRPSPDALVSNWGRGRNAPEGR